MYISFLGCVYDKPNPESCSKLYEEITIDDLENPVILTSYLMDLWNIRGTDCPVDCAAIKYCTNKPKMITSSFISKFVNNITYYNDEIKKELTSIQSRIRYDKKEEIRKSGKKRKDDSQLSLF